MKKLLFGVFVGIIFIIIVGSLSKSPESQKITNIHNVSSQTKSDDKSENQPSIKGTVTSSNSETKSSVKYSTPEEYAKTLIWPEAGIYNATVTDIGMLVIAVDAQPNVNFDYFAKSYLDGALKEGVSVKGCLIVDVKDCLFMKGAVTGKRIGKAYR